MAAGDLSGVVRWALVGISVFALACVVGTASAGSKSRKDTAADAEKSYKKVVVMSDKEGKPYLGITMQELDDNLRKGLDVTVKNGVLVTDVIEGGPAEEAGIEDGDVIVEFKGRRVESPSELRNLIEESEVGDAADVKVVRENKTKTITVTLGSYPHGESWSVINPEYMQWFGDNKEALMSVFGRARLGVDVTDINEDLAPYFGVKAGEGVLVVGVTEGSPGHKVGIKAGDVIVRVNDETVGSADELREAVGDLDKGDEFAVAVVRSKADLTLRGEMDEAPVKMYSKLAPHEFDVRVPEIDMRRITDVEMEGLKKEMKALKKEVEALKDELEKVKKST